MLINEKHIIKLYQFELIVFAFLLPFYRQLIPFVIAILVITWLLEGDFAGKVRRLANCSHRLNTLLFAGIYLLYGIGLFYSSNLNDGYFDMEVKMSMFIFPVIMASMRKEILQWKFAKKLLKTFVLGVFVSMVLRYVVALFDYLETDSLQSFYYSRLSIFFHTSYMAMYVCFAISIILYFYLMGWLQNRFQKIMALVLILLFMIFVIMLSSKAGILSLVLVIAMFTSYIWFYQRKFIKGVIYGGLLSAAFIFLFLVFPVSAERFDQTREAIGEMQVNEGEGGTSTGDRLMIWWYSFEITNINFLSGVGTGDVKDELVKKYDEKAMSNAFELRLNAHNQYLQTFIALGVIGLIVLLLNLILPAFYSIEHKHYLYLMFLLLVGFNFIFESMLETQAGVVFYAFFNAYLFAIKKDPVPSETGSQ
jgi:O-antigen ligase